MGVIIKKAVNKTLVFILLIFYGCSNNTSKVEQRRFVANRDTSITIIRNNIVITGKPTLDSASILSIKAKFEPFISFEDFKISSIYNGKKALLDSKSKLIEAEYKSIILNDYEKATINFSGHYCLISYRCGAPCQNFILVDVIEGQVYDGFISENGFQFNLLSRMIIANPPDSLGYYDANCSYCLPEIWIWDETNKTFTNIKSKK